MAELNPVPYLQNSGATNTAQLLRFAIGSLLNNPGGIGAGGIGGVHPALDASGDAGGLSVSAGGGLSVNVAAGVAYVPGSTDTNQGMYVCVNTSTVNKTLTAADGANPRIDLVICRVRDSFYTGVDDDWLLDVVTGTPAGSPTAPTLPASSLALAEVLVPAAAVVPSTITDRRTFLTAVGGIERVSSTAALPTVKLYTGQMAYDVTNEQLLVRDNSAWNPIGAVKAPTRQTVTVTGTYTTPAGLKSAFVREWGGGGSGGGCAATGAGTVAESGGGGGGEYREIWYTAAELGASAAVTIGAAGAAPAAGDNDGNTGGTTTFNPAGTGVTLTANGGGGGEGAAASASNNTLNGGTGGTGGSGGTGFPGSDGGLGRCVNAEVTGHGNFGGAAPNGASTSVPDASSAGRVGKFPGGGGSGCNNGNNQAARAGGAGAVGVVIVDEYYA